MEKNSPLYSATSKNFKPAEIFIMNTSPLNKSSYGVSKTPELSNPMTCYKSQKNLHLMFQELRKIEEEFDLKNSTFYIKHNGDYETAHCKYKDVKIAEVFIEEIISCLQFFEKRIGKILAKSWKIYQKAANKGVKKEANEQSIEKNYDKIEGKDVAVQAFEEIDLSEDEDFSDFAESLNCALGRIHNMNHKKLVKKLSKLLEKLNVKNRLTRFGSDESIDLPDKYVFPANKNEASMKLSEDAKVLRRAKKKQLSVICMSKETQTGNGSSPDISQETLISLLNERDRNIYQLRESVSKYARTEEYLRAKLNQAEGEITSCKQTIKDLQDSILNNSKEKETVLKIEKQQFEELKKQHTEEIKMTLKKNEKIEFELVTTKQMLKESENVIGKGNEKINKLSEEIQLLNSKINSILIERKKLEEKLNEEENLKFDVLNKINMKNSVSPPKSKQNYFMDFSNSSKNKNDPSRMISFSSLGDRSVIDKSSKSETPINADKSYFGQSNKSVERVNFQKTSTIVRPDSQLIREKYSGLASVNEKHLSRSHFLRKTNIYTVLKISKQEFLNFSKLARMELFECLYEHKSKCGDYCEHLKRAEMIKSRERGRIYPLRKYNI